MSSNVIRWLHLSDFHVGKDDYGQRRLFKYILENVQAKVEAGEDPHLVFITGDIADKGLADEYKLFEEEFLNPLRKCLPADCAQRIFIVPGNHDVDRTKARAVDTDGTLTRVPRFLDPTEEGLSERKVIFERFDAFVGAIIAGSGAQWLFSPDGAFRQILELEGCRIGILGINTAWLSFNENDRHRLSAGKPIIEDGLEKIKECRIRIVLGHHPIDWLLDDEVEPVRSLFGKHSILYLHGHLHKNQSRPDSGAENPFRIIQSGAAFQEREDERWVNRFLWCALDLENGQVLAEPLKWARKHQGWGIDSDAFPKKLKVAGKDLWAIPLPGHKGAAEPKDHIWKVPHQRNPRFTGRKELLAKMQEVLGEKGEALKIAVLYGLGGVGKTQIALQHVYDRQKDYSLVWWLRAEDPTTLKLDYAKLGEELQLPFESNSPELVPAVKRWLETNQGWLLVFDNAVEPKDLKEYLPQGNGGAIITSRNQNWRSLAEPMKVQELPPDDAAAFLVDRTGDKDQEAALVLAKELGCLPLALEQAGAYIEACGSSCAKYLILFRVHHQELLKQGKPLDYPDTVATTWKISFESLRKECPAAADLMNLCAFFAPEAIPFDLFTEHPEHLPASLKRTARDQMKWDEAIGGLKRYSLAEMTTDSLSFHRLVQMVVRNGMKPAARKRKVAAAVSLINDAYGFERDDLETWPRAAQLLPHGLAAAEHSHLEQGDDESTARLLNWMGLHLRVLGKFAEGKGLVQRALSVSEKLEGPDRAMVCAILNNLASLLQDLGDFKAAKETFQKALKIAKKVYGSNHPEVASCLNDLGLVLMDFGDFKGAAGQIERALKINEKAYGPDHPWVATALNNLGIALQDLGDLQGAKANLERALAILRAWLGDDHPKTKLVLENLKSLESEE